MLANFALGHAPERKSDARESMAVEAVEHVGLVLGWIDGGVQLRPVLAVHDAGVVTGGELLEAELQDAGEHEVEADERVAAHARVRGPAFEVVPMERLDDPLAELRLEVPAVIRNVEDGCDPPCVFDRRQRAAAAMP